MWCNLCSLSSKILQKVNCTKNYDDRKSAESMSKNASDSL